jgi:molecular chaperone IbpA
MTNVHRYRAGDLGELFDKITKNSIGLDQYIDQFWQTASVTYPPYNILQHSNHESSLEIALAGFKKKEVKVYTEHGKLIVEGKKEEKKDDEYVHRGMAQRSFQREWQLSEDVEITKVTFEDGLLTVDLGKIVPEHHARKNYL